MKENFLEYIATSVFILAPMEDVTDIVFRHVVSEAARPDVFLLNLPILRVTATLKVFIVCADA